MPPALRLADAMRFLVLTAPSGAGKTTIARRLMAEVPGLRFSVSATTRPPRRGERHGVDYFFLTPNEFERRVAAGDFVEHEEVYPGRFYGTLRAEIERIAASDDVRAAMLDVDVRGALAVKTLYGAQALTLFIQPPSIEALGDRLRARGTESEERIAVRLDRARMEMDTAPAFDAVVVNDDLDAAVAETVRLAVAFLGA
jgi:guanylate kinase